MGVMEGVGRLFDWLCVGHPRVTVIYHDSLVRHATYVTPEVEGEAAVVRPLLVTDSTGQETLLRIGTWLLDLPVGLGGKTVRDVTHHLDTTDLAQLDPAVWISAPSVVLDERSAQVAVKARLPRHRNLVVVTHSPSAWTAAVALSEGAATVVTVPDNTGWLLTHLAEEYCSSSAAAPGRNSDPARHTEASGLTYLL